MCCGYTQTKEIKMAMTPEEIDALYAVDDWYISSSLWKDIDTGML